MADNPRRNSRDTSEDGGSPSVDARVLEAIGRMEKKLDGDEKFRETITLGISDCQTRLTRIESEIHGSGGIVGRGVCHERAKAIDDRIAKMKETCDSREHDRQAGHARAVWFQGIIAAAAISALLGLILSYVVKK